MSKIKTWEQREAEACADPKNSHRLIHTITEESKLAEIGELRGKLAALEGQEPVAWRVPVGEERFHYVEGALEKSDKDHAWEHGRKYEPLYLAAGARE